MGFFSFLNSRRRTTESEAVIKLLRQWEHEHFKGNNNRKSPYFKYNTYLTVSGNEIRLNNMRVPSVEMTLTERILNGIKDFLEYSVPITNMAQLVADFRDKIFSEISSYRDNILLLQKFNKEFRSDALFVQIDHAFYVKLNVLYHELLLCEFDELHDLAYFQKTHAKILRLIADLKQLNSYFSDYMHALANIGHEDVSQDLQLICTQVAAMTAVADS